MKKWPSVALGDIFDIARGGSPRPIDDFITDSADGLNWVMISDASASGKIIYRTKKRIRPEGLRKTRQVVAGDFILSNSMSFGRPYIMGTNGCIHDGWLLMRPKTPQFDADYFYHLLGSPDVYESFSSRAAGATVKNLNSEIVREVEIPLPPLDEQKRIAAILDQADALRRLRTRALDRLNALGQAIFHEMFGDPRTNPKRWPIVRLSELGELERGVSKHRPRNEPALLGGDHPLIQTGDVSRAGDYIENYGSTYSELGLRQSRKWPQGTLCITIAANIADTAILDFDACFPDSVVGFNSGSKPMNFFVHRWFATVKAHLEQIAPAVAQKNINLAILRELPVIKPDIHVVTEFFRRETLLRTQITVASRSLLETHALFTSLQHRAFRGEL